MEFLCDECSSLVDVTDQKTVRRDGIEARYFRCPSCGHVYTISVTDPALRAKVRELQKIMRRIQKGGVVDDYIRKAMRLKDENVKRCRELAVLYPPASLLSEK